MSGPSPLRRTQGNLGVLSEVGIECNWVDIPVSFKRNSSPWPRGRAAPWSGLCLSLLWTNTHFLSSAQGYNCFSCHFVRTDSCGLFFFFNEEEKAKKFFSFAIRLFLTWIITLKKKHLSLLKTAHHRGWRCGRWGGTFIPSAELARHAGDSVGYSTRKQ